MSIEIPIKIGLSGYYKIEKIRNGNLETVCDWFPNLITDNGLDLFVENQKIQYCCVGSGNDSPAASDTQLQSYIADTASSSANDGINTTDNYVYARVSYTFSTGSAEGILSEVGVGQNSGGTNLFSRALIVDSAGDPTTITVLADEILIVTYECRLHQPLADYNLTVDGYDIVLRSSAINTFSSNNGWESIRTSMLLEEGDAYDGTIGDVTQQPSGSQDSSTSETTDSYIGGSYTLTGELLFGINDANFMISAIFYRFEVAGAYQFSIDPPIDKDDTKEVRIAVRVTWARQGELPS